MSQERSLPLSSCWQSIIYSFITQNRIKARAREHETFRRIFVSFAQRVHRVDMRMRLGILHDTAAQERMAAREAAEANAKKRSGENPTVRTEAEQKRHDSEVKEDGDKAASKKEKTPKPIIRPLSEARAIDLGANFASEAFIFMVAAGLLVFERWWSRRRESAKDEHVVERLSALEEQTETIGYLEAEVQRLKSKADAYDILQAERAAETRSSKASRKMQETA